MVEYFSTTRWDGAVDLSWYNGTDTEFTLTTPAQLAGVAELVNSNTTDFAGKTIRLGADIFLLRYEETGKLWRDGIVGMAETGTTIQDCVNFGVVTGSGTSNGAGGIIGKLNGTNLLRCANYGGVAPTQSWHTGGTGPDLGLWHRHAGGGGRQGREQRKHPLLLRYQRRPVWQRRRKAAGVRRHLCEPHRLRPYRQDCAGAGGTRHLHRDRPYRYRLVTVSFRHRQTAL